MCSYLESSVERIHHVLQAKGADGRSVNGVLRCGEDAVDQTFRTVSISSLHDVARRFCVCACNRVKVSQECRPLHQERTNHRPASRNQPLPSLSVLSSLALLPSLSCSLYETSWNLLLSDANLLDGLRLERRDSRRWSSVCSDRNESFHYA